MNSQHQSLEEFIEYLEKPNSDYSLVAKDLPENPNTVDKFKFDICQMIITYKHEKKLTSEELAKRIHLNIDALVESHREELQKDIIQKILFCWIEYFSLGELIVYAEQLSLSIELKISFGSKSSAVNSLESYQGEWDKTLNDQKILEIVQTRTNNKSFEPLPEPLLLWNKEVFYIETTYRRIKYRMIFWVKEDGALFVRNIWVMGDIEEKDNE